MRLVLAWLRERAAPIGAALGLLAVLLGPTISPDCQLLYRDTGRLYYPVKQYLAQRLRRGELPLWDPRTEAGTSVLGQVSPGLLHPSTLLYLALPFDLAFKLNHLLAIPLALVGTVLLARRLGSSRPAAFAAGIVFGFSGFLLSTASSNLPYALGPSTVPLALHALLWLCDRPAPGRLLWASGVFASIVLAGDPQSAAFTGILGLGLAVLASPSVGQSARRWPWVAAWGLAAILLAAPALLPAASRFGMSKRAQGVSAAERAMFANSPARLLGLLVPLAFDDTVLESSNAPQPYPAYFAPEAGASFIDAICIGAPALLLAAFAAHRRRGRALLLAAFVCALASTGTALGIEGVLQLILPPLRSFRYAEKWIAPATLLFALAAGLGLDEALATIERRAVALAAWSAALAAACLAAWGALIWNRAAALGWLTEAAPSHLPDTARDLLELMSLGLLMTAGLAASTGLVGLYATLSGRRGMAAWLACASCAAAALLTGKGLIKTAPLEVLQDPPPIAVRLHQLAPHERRPRAFFDEGPKGGKTLMVNETDPRVRSSLLVIRKALPQYDSLFGFDGVNPYFSLPDARYAAALEGAPFEMLALLDTRFFVFHGDLSPGEVRAHGFGVGPDSLYYRVAPPSPRAFLVGAAQLQPDIPSAVRALRKLPTLDSTVVLEEADAAIARGLTQPGPAGQAHLHRRTPESFDAEVAAERVALLVVSEHYDPGWEARVDGQPVPVVRGDLVALTVPVPAGRHKVTLRFWPSGFRLGLALCGATLLALAGLSLRLRLRRRA